MTKFVAALLIALAGLTIPAHTQAAPASTPPVEAWAFCGVHPDSANAAEAVATLAAAHIDATFGPCLKPGADYTVANPGQRYATPAVYHRLVELNASVGIKTVVYDARLWSTNPGTRLNAYQLWAPHLASIAAWDLGDEYDPRTADWDALKARWAWMASCTTPVTGILPYTNHLPWTEVLDQALTDLGADALSFDSYDLPTCLDLTARYAPQTGLLTVAVSALDYGQGAPTPEGIVTAMHALTAAGADRFLVFGGAYPYNPDLTPDPAFGGRSIIDNLGHATPLGAAILQGASS